MKLIWEVQLRQQMPRQRCMKRLQSPQPRSARQAARLPRGARRLPARARLERQTLAQPQAKEQMQPQPREKHKVTKVEDILAVDGTDTVGCACASQAVVS